MTELPIIGAVPYPLVFAALIWSVLRAPLSLALAGIKLPGLEFKNQRVEAAFRKELVYGEDDAERAQPPTLRELFAQCAPELFHALRALHLLQCDPLHLSARPTESSSAIL